MCFGYYNNTYDQHLLDVCNGLPPMSPAIKDYLISKEEKFLQSEDVDYTPNKDELSLKESSAHNLSLGTLSSGDPSVVDEIHEELEDCELSLDDQLLRGADAAVMHRREMFCHELQRVKQRINETIHLEEMERLKQVRQVQERKRMEEMRR